MELDSNMFLCKLVTMSSAVQRTVCLHLSLNHTSSHVHVHVHVDGYISTGFLEESLYQSVKVNNSTAMFLPP